MKLITMLILVVFFQDLFAQLDSEKRIALVVGNADYLHANKLRNPVNDATMMADSLKKIGFDVIKVIDASKNAFYQAIYDFSKKLPRYSTTLFFYAGHGVQVDGINYLLPVDAVIEEKNDIKFQAIPVTFITEELERYSNTTNILILDACRNNPFPSWTRGISIGTGLAHIPNQPAGSIIAYATRENTTAEDGTGRNGLYTGNLIREIMKPQSVHEVFNNTRMAVLQQSKYSQCPQEWNMLTKPFYFIKPQNETPKKPVILPHKLFNAAYSLYRDTTAPENCKVTEFEISDVTDTSFLIRGIGQSWEGKGVLHKDNTGRYDWVFQNGAKGSSYIIINSHGSIKGRVTGSNVDLDWIYIAYPMN
jgi:hypothetical protein